MRGKQNSLLRFLSFIIIVFIIGSAIYLFISGKKQIVSPVPKEPNVTVIFYTPTPASEATPTSTPSATPKVKKASPTITPKPKSTTTPAATSSGNL